MCVRRLPINAVMLSVMSALTGLGLKPLDFLRQGIEGAEEIGPAILATRMVQTLNPLERVVGELALIPRTATGVPPVCRWITVFGE